VKITIIYFSQTGNTRRVAQTMAEVFRLEGHPTRTISLKNANHQHVISTDVLGIGAPCFVSRAPTPIKLFLQTLPPLVNQRAFVFATSGGAPGRVLSDLTKLLQSRGAEVLGGFLTRGELFYPLPCLLGRMRNRPNAGDLDRARFFASAVCEHLSSGQSGTISGSRIDTFKPRGGFYDYLALLGTDGFQRLLLPEPKTDLGRCNQCQWCVYECPMDNITLEPYPVFGDQCIRCYRCLTGCPQKALDADLRFGNLATLLFYNTIFERWFGDLEPGESIY